MANEAQKDTERALAAAKVLFDGRDPENDSAAILVTLEGLVSVVLLATQGSNASQAADMLNEGLAPGVEGRLAQFASDQLGKAEGQ